MKIGSAAVFMRTRNIQFHQGKRKNSLAKQLIDRAKDAIQDYIELPYLLLNSGVKIAIPVDTAGRDSIVLIQR